MAAAVGEIETLAQKGDRDGQHWLACCCRIGMGVEKDEVRAAMLYRLSADQGCADAQYALGECEKVYVVHRRDSFRADALYLSALSELPNVELVLNSTVEAIRSTTDGEVPMPHVESILVRDRNTGDERVVNTDAVFIAVGTTPRSNVLKAAGVALNEAGYAIAGESGATNVPGVFVAGDVREKPLRQVITAASDGANAATAAFEYLNLD